MPKLAFKAYCDSGVYRRRCDNGRYCTHQRSEGVKNVDRRVVAIFKDFIDCCKRVMKAKNEKGLILRIDDVNRQLELRYDGRLIVIIVKVGVVNFDLSKSNDYLTNEVLKGVVDMLEWSMPCGLFDWVGFDFDDWIGRKGD